MLLKNKAFLIFIIVIILASILYFVVDFNLCPSFNRKPTSTVDNEEYLAIDYEAIITSKIGEEIIIVLESNPTTGYQWQVGYDSGRLELASQEFIVPEDSDLVGAPGEEIFIFKALERGESDIAFSYLRPWETDTNPEKRLYYKIIAE